MTLTFPPHDFSVSFSGSFSPSKTRWLQRVARALPLEVRIIRQASQPPTPTSPLEGLDLLEAQALLIDTEEESPHSLAWGAQGDSPQGVLRTADQIWDLWQRKIQKRPVKALVLAGGHSRRMGQDKAALDHHGLSQLDRTVQLLEPHVQGVWVSCRRDQEHDPVRRRFSQIHDRYLDMGPAGGILSALESDRDCAWLVAACDLPLLEENTVKTLLQGRNPFQLATAFQNTEGLPEPLFAVYEPKARARFLQFMAAGIRCPRKVLVHSPTTLLPCPDLDLTNANEPQEWSWALGQVHRARRVAG